MMFGVWLAVAAWAGAGIAGTDGDGRPAVRWRGFNLLGMFHENGRQPKFNEEDFKLIHELGFNFVRLPMDYRFWIKDKNWEAIDEAALAPVDQAVAYGKKYGIHVQLCFHRAPGYTVAKPAEPRDLFTDAEALRVCRQHWAFFARRYKGVPPSELSFNLFNEPGDIDAARYAAVASALVEAIRAEDPKRLIMADGLKWGRDPVPALFGLGIAQATRGYTPMSISHYRASWVNVPDVPPEWPLAPRAFSPLYGSAKAPWNVPLVVADVPAGTRVTLEPGFVSGKATYIVEADGATVLEQTLEPRVDDPDHWTNAVHKAEWNVTQGRYLGTLTGVLPQGTQKQNLSVRVAGDWAGVRGLTLTAMNGREATARLRFEDAWGKTNGVFRFAGFGAPGGSFIPPGGVQDGRAYLQKELIDAWRPAVDAGVFVMVGEFGAHNQTPHDITLAWLEDCLKLWKDNGWGWAMWNLTGSFGVLDSGRADVAYEEFHGHQLDRKMLDLLLRY
jgi:aryl-phospho-beta-D-glucosidase BglC (GH1 family)